MWDIAKYKFSSKYKVKQKQSVGIPLVLPYIITHFRLIANPI